MKTFHYLPPAVEEQRAFVTQFLGTIVALALVVGAWFFVKEARIHAILAGVSLGAIYLLIRAAWTLETKAQRSQNAEIAFDETELRLTNRHGKTQVFVIKEIEKCEVRGGRLLVVSGGNRVLEIGARELEDGMTFVRELLEIWSGETPNESDKSFRPPSNFIPLEPR